MTSKKKNKRSYTKRIRGVLNKVLTFSSNISGRRLTAHGYGCGINRKAVRENDGDAE